MSRVASIGSFCLLALWLSGCTSFFTARAIESFTAGLAAGKLEDLQASTSADFQQRALRVAEALDSLAVLPLPREEGTVKEIQELGPDERLVTVEVGEPPRTVQYRLKREAPDGERRGRKWVVDDVILTQARPGDQPPLTKSVTEQMDLLITVQEFLKFWSEGSREETLARLHPDLRSPLEELSPVHLAQVTDRFLSGIKLETFRPEARIQTNRATVQLPRQSGQLVLELVRLSDPAPRWVIQDAVLHSTRGRPPESAAHVARCVRQATEFLRAYEARDREALRQVASPTFYEQALQAADFDTVPLPIPRLLATRFELEEHDHRIDLLFDVGEDTYLVTMTREREQEPRLRSSPAPASPCRVEELTIYERGGAQIKPLSVLFTAQAVVEVYAEALAARDVSLLSQLSTRDLNERVWERLASPEVIEGFPWDGIPGAPPRIVTTIFQGPVTEITVTQGTRALTYVLHSTSGRPQVDDVRFPANNRSGSLKTTFSVLVPVHNFAWAWKQRNVELLARNSSEGLRRIIWSRTDRVPEIAVDMDRFLPGTMPRIEELGHDVLVTLGTPERGMMVRLVNERGRLQVEDLHLIGKELPAGKLELAAAMRDWVNAEAGKPAPRRTTAQTAPDANAALTAVPDRKPKGFERSGRRSTATVSPTDAMSAGPEAAASVASPSAENTVPLLQQPIPLPGA